MAEPPLDILADRIAGKGLVSFSSGQKFSVGVAAVETDIHLFFMQKKHTVTYIGVLLLVIWTNMYTEQIRKFN